MLTPRWRARLDWYAARHNDFVNYGAPMNGQQARLEMTRQIMASCRFSRIVETGTYRSATTVWLAEFGLPVTTVEVDPECAEFSRRRLKRYPNVELIHGNSVDALGALAAATTRRQAAIFFYLDAHWGDLPLRDEIKIITTNFPKAVIMIDDFKVPDDPGYGFDDYGPGERLSLDYLARCNTPPLAVYFPSAPSAAETLAKRGSVTVTADPGLAAIFDRLPALRRWPFASATQQNRAGLVRGDKTN